MSKAKFDPLENAKLGTEKPPTPAAPAPAAARPAQPAAASSPPSEPFASGDSPRAKTEPPELPPTPAAEAPSRPRYRVLEAKRVGVNGQMVNMAVGRVIDSAGYGGEAGIAKLRSQGLRMELVK